jgi:hypothetical protein
MVLYRATTPAETFPFVLDSRALLPTIIFILFIATFCAFGAIEHSVLLFKPPTRTRIASLPAALFQTYFHAIGSFTQRLTHYYRFRPERSGDQPTIFKYQ